MATKNIELSKFAVRKPVVKTNVEEQAVAAIHSPTPSVQPVFENPKVKVQTTRISLDTPQDMYMQMLAITKPKKVSLKEYILGLVKADLEKY